MNATRTPTPECTLCGAPADYFCRDRRRRFYRCPRCELAFADPQSHLHADEERAVYELHENDPKDADYRAFLGRLATPLLERLQAGMSGLDYGCGPGPTLSGMLREAGMTMANYDPLYVPEPRALERQYDFVTCTEVVEHFRAPARDWRTLAQRVRPGGWLGIMTWLVPELDADAFRGWGYKGDPTHVSFYRPATLHWIGRQLGLTVEIISERVILMQKQPQGNAAGSRH